MEESTNGIGDQLVEAARRSTPLSVVPETLIRRVKRRRRVRAAGLSAVVVLASAGTALTIRAEPLPTVPAERLPEPAGAADTPAPQASSADAMQLRDFRCGGRIDPPTIPTAAIGSVRLSIDHIRRTVDGRPQADVSIRTTEPVSFPATPGPTNLQMLLLKDGVIVAGQSSRSRSGPSGTTGVARPLQVAHADAAHPYRQVVLPRSAAVCTGQSWDQLWGNGDAYQIAIVVSTLDLSGAPKPPTPGPGGRTLDPLLLATTPLQPR